MRRICPRKQRQIRPMRRNDAGVPGCRLSVKYKDTIEKERMNEYYVGI